jgi:hypothetical protein
MKPRYRVTSASHSTAEANAMIDHAIKFEWWITKETEIILTADAYCVAIGVRLPVVTRLKPKKYAL